MLYDMILFMSPDPKEREEHHPPEVDCTERRFPQPHARKRTDQEHAPCYCGNAHQNPRTPIAFVFASANGAAEIATVRPRQGYLFATLWAVVLKRLWTHDTR